LTARPPHGRAAEGEERDGAGRSGLAAWLCALSLAGLGRTVRARPEWERAAEGAAWSWLGLVDHGRHSASRASASPLLREEVSPLDWAEALDASRVPLGRRLFRRRQSCAVVEGPPGAPRGPFVVLRFESVFERQARAVETITLALGPDDRWRVAAYFIG
jgi:hypothetical protein